MEVVASIDNVLKALQFTRERIDDWRNVVPEGIAMRTACISFQNIIKDAVDKPNLPISDELQDVNNTIEETNKIIKEFLDEDNLKSRSGWSDFEWQIIRRPILAYRHRTLFKATTEKLEASKTELVKALKFSAAMAKPTAYWFKESMVNEACFKFWKGMCGEDLQVSNWAIFTQTYQRQFNEEWDGDQLERIRRVACSGEDTQLSIAGYISLTSKCGFPLNYDNLPEILDSHTVVSAQTRMDVAKMINELITYYSTKEMRDLLVSIFTWYKGVTKRANEGKDWQDRANEWGETIKKNRGKHVDELDERGKLAEQVDMARRTYSFFFQRYMVVFKIGQLSKEMFAEVDFPGKARMFEFMDHVKPLDHANYHIVIGGDPDEWESKQPKVYKFLRDFISSEKKAKLKKEATAAAVAAAAAKALEQMNLDDNTVIDLDVANRDPPHDIKVQMT